MLGIRNTVIGVMLIVSICIGYWLVKRSSPPVSDERGASSYQVGALEVYPEAEKAPAHVTSTKDDQITALLPQDGVIDCVNPSQLESDPALAEEYARLDRVITSGPTIASYRGISSDQLGHLSVQGDSAAMAVLGAISVMKARRLPEERAVGYLLREDPDVWSFSLERPLEPEVVKHIEDARDWFYKSALHGRLLALENVGEMVEIIAGTPTELGWIEENEYSSLTVREKYALEPTTVYHALVFELAPELLTGPFGAVNAELALGGEIQQAILSELGRQFSEDREAAGLPPIIISESRAMSMEELAAMLCEP